MGGFNYNNIAKIAQTQLARFGVVAQLISTDGLTSRDVLVVRDKDVKYSLSQTMEGVQVGDAQFWANATDQTGAMLNPQQGETLVVAGDNFTLMAKPMPIKPAILIVLWQLFGRDGATYVV